MTTFYASFLTFMAVVAGVWAVPRLGSPGHGFDQTSVLLTVFAVAAGGALTAIGLGTWSAWLLFPSGLLLGSLTHAAFRLLRAEDSREARSAQVRALARVNALPLICRTLGFSSGRHASDDAEQEGD